MKHGKVYFAYICLGFTVLCACNSVSNKILTPPTVTMTLTTVSVAVPTETATPISAVISTPTIEVTSEWLPYNPNIDYKGCDDFIATLPIQGTDGWSEEKIGEKLFGIYLEHYKSPSLGGGCRLEKYIIEETKFDQMVAFLTKDQKMDFTLTVKYSIQIQEVPSTWVAGNGELAKEGWIAHKFLIIGVIKGKDQYILHLIGTGP